MKILSECKEHYWHIHWITTSAANNTKYVKLRDVPDAEENQECRWLT